MDLHITLLGDLKHGPTVHSLVKLLRMYDVQLNFVSPQELSLPSPYLMDDDCQYTDLSPIIENTDILYVTRVQRERLADTMVIDFSYAVTREDMDRAKENLVLMHPLPRVGEIPAELDADPRAAYFRQLKYGLYVRMGILVAMIGRD